MALRLTHRFRLAGHSRLDFSGNSDPETDLGRKVGGTKVGGTKKGGMAPLSFCGVVPLAEFFSSRHHRSVSTGHCYWCRTAGCRATGPPLGFVEVALVSRLITPFVNRIVAVSQNDL